MTGPAAPFARSRLSGSLYALFAWRGCYEARPLGSAINNLGVRQGGKTAGRDEFGQGPQAPQDAGGALSLWPGTSDEDDNVAQDVGVHAQQVLERLRMAEILPQRVL